MEIIKTINRQPITIPVGRISLHGDLTLPASATGLVLFAHGSGSSRLSPRNQFVADALNQTGLGTCLFDLLTSEEEAEDFKTGHIRFNIDLLASRLTGVADWLQQESTTRDLSLGLFGASTGAAAAIITASDRPRYVKAVVSRGGRPDMAKGALRNVGCAVLLIIGSRDEVVIELNREAFNLIPSDVPKDLAIVPGATHLFEEPGKLENVATLACAWFLKYLI